MSTTTNYYKRSIDLSVFQGIDEKRMVTVNQSLFNNGGEVCTGLQKLIQRWLITFLTPKGAVKFHPNWGTTYVSESTGFHSEIDAEIAFYSANADACEQMRREEDNNMELEERIEKVTLEDISIYDTGFSLHVTIVSRFGESAPLVLPINVNPII